MAKHQIKVADFDGYTISKIIASSSGGLKTLTMIARTDGNIQFEIRKDGHLVSNALSLENAVQEYNLV